MAGGVRRVLFDTDMLARLRARRAVPGFRGVRPAGTTVRRPRLTGALTLRLASAAAAVPFLLGVARLGEPFYGAFICIACAYAAFEVRGLLRAGGYAPMDFALFATAVLLPLDAWWHLTLHHWAPTAYHWAPIACSW